MLNGGQERARARSGKTEPRTSLGSDWQVAPWFSAASGTGMALSEPGNARFIAETSIVGPAELENRRRSICWVAAVCHIWLWSRRRTEAIGSAADGLRVNRSDQSGGLHPLVAGGGGEATSVSLQPVCSCCCCRLLCACRELQDACVRGPPATLH